MGTTRRVKGSSGPVKKPYLYDIAVSNWCVNDINLQFFDTANPSSQGLTEGSALRLLMTAVALLLTKSPISMTAPYQIGAPKNTIYNFLMLWA